MVAAIEQHRGAPARPQGVEADAEKAEPRQRRIGEIGLRDDIHLHDAVGRKAIRVERDGEEAEIVGEMRLGGMAVDADRGHHWAAGSGPALDPQAEHGAPLAQERREDKARLCLARRRAAVVRPSQPAIK